MEKSIHEERYSALKEALMHEFGERNINSSAMEEDNNIEFLIDWNHNTVSLMIGPVLENQDEYVVVSNVYGEAGTKVNIVIDGIDGIVSYDNLCNHIITKIRRKTMENETNTKLRSLLSIRAKLNEVFKDEISWNENLPTEQGLMCFIYKCIIISITILNNGDIIISSNIGSGVAKLPSEAIDFIANMVKENGVYMRKNYKASFNAGKTYKDFLPYLTEYGYHNFGVAHEPLILEPEDWIAAQWETICKLFGMDNAERIKVSGYKLEAFGLPKASNVTEPKNSESEDMIRKQIIIKTKDPDMEGRVLNKIHNQLVGNQDYIGSRICLNRSKDRNDGTQNEVHLYIFEDSESDPEINI